MIGTLFINGKEASSLYVNGNQVFQAQSYAGLCFTAEQPNSTISLAQLAGTFQWSSNGRQWNDYTLNTVIPLANIGDKVYFKAKTQNATIYPGGTARRTFATGKMSVTGNIMSLLDETMQRNYVSPDEFNRFFAGGGWSFTSSPLLPAEILGNGCYNQMFLNCYGIQQPPVLSSTHLAANCYFSMFEGCSGLSAMPLLPAKSLRSRCYYRMFDSCTSLTGATPIIADSADVEAFSLMFNNCKYLEVAPVLSVQQANEGAFAQMFSSCIRLKSVPRFYVGSNPDGMVAYNMFEYCSGLETPPQLPDIDMSIGYDYWGMFIGCTSLTSLPALTSDNLGEGAYGSMFSGCTSLNAAPVISASVLGTECFTDMFTDTPNVTSVHLPNVFERDYDDSSYGPFASDHNVTKIFKKPYEGLCFTALQANCTVILDNVAGTFQTSRNGGNTWADYTLGTAITLANIGDKVWFKAKTQNATLWNNDYDNYRFKTTGLLACSGNVMSLLDETCQRNDVPHDCFYCLFWGTTITTPPELPATSFGSTQPHQYEYSCMFYECHDLSVMPRLPAPVLSTMGTYAQMFYDCQSLTGAVTIDASSFGQQTQQVFDMFGYSENITSVLMPNMYEVDYDIQANGAFSDNRAIPIVFKKPYALAFKAIQSGEQATIEAILSEGAPQDYVKPKWEYSFDLQTWTPMQIQTYSQKVPVQVQVGQTLYLRAQAGGNQYISNQDGTGYVSIRGNGKFECSGSVMSLLDRDVVLSAVPTDNCFFSLFYSNRNIVTAPELPAVTLTRGSYMSMFNNCTSLAVGPELPAQHVPEFAYGNMFYHCDSLSAIPHIHVSTASVGSFTAMFQYCNSLKQIKMMLDNHLYGNGIDGSAISYCQQLSAVMVAQAYPSGIWLDGCSGLKYIDLGSTNLAGVDTFYADEPNPIETLVLRSSTVMEVDSEEQPYLDMDLENCTHIYVPDSLVSSYKADSVWSAFSSVIYPISQLPPEPF